ncbi:MAG TPA: hypothetical protein VMS08_01135 [Candidatus Saccharimonadia bacterium]|nr:hypothetical protein [Candidatus Saccharimonadia bacterium]
MDPQTFSANIMENIDTNIITISHPDVNCTVSQAKQPDDQVVRNIRASIRLLARGGNPLLELRALKKPKGTWSGYYDDYERMAKDAERPSASPNFKGTFITINPVDADSPQAARARNTSSIVGEGQTTNDNAIAKRYWIPIDLDPARRGVKADNSSTEEEKALSRDTADRVIKLLSEYGITSYVLCDSGNGYHVLIPVDLPNDKPSTELVQRFLFALHDCFTIPDYVKVDTGIFNAARIIKLHGTMVRKGDDTPERPHRRSSIIAVVIDGKRFTEPGDDGNWPDPPSARHDAIASVAALHLEQGPGAKKAPVFLWAEFLKDHPDIEARPAKDSNGKMVWPVQCPNPEHRPWKGYITRHADGGVAYGCQHTSCKVTFAEYLEHVAPDWEAGPAAEKYRPVKAGKENMATRLRNYVLNKKSVELFTDPTDGKAYITVEKAACEGIAAHKETHRIGSPDFNNWLRNDIPEALGSISATVMKEVADNVASKVGNKKQIAFLRVGHDEAKKNVYIDQGDPGWHVFEITKDGWRVIEYAACPVRFRRVPTTGALPTPERGGSIHALWKYANFKPEHRVLVLPWLAYLLITHGERMNLMAGGPDGNGKTSAGGFLKALIDPDGSWESLRTAPDSFRDLKSAVRQSLFLGYDNFSNIPKWLSDCLCTLNTGGNLSRHALYGDDEEAPLYALRGVLVTSIVDPATRSDLLSRFLNVEMNPLAGKDDLEAGEIKWAKPTELRAGFKQDWAGMLGALYDAVVIGLRDSASVDLPETGRMPDFWAFGYVVVQACGFDPADLIAAMVENAAKNRDTATDASLIYPGLMGLLADNPDGWEGEPTEFRKALLAHGGDEIKNKLYPSNPAGITRELKRLQRTLKEQGIEYRVGKTGGRRFIYVGPRATAKVEARGAYREAYREGHSVAAAKGEANAFAFAETYAKGKVLADAIAERTTVPVTGSGEDAM